MLFFGVEVFPVRFAPAVVDVELFTFFDAPSCFDGEHHAVGEEVTVWLVGMIDHRHPAEADDARSPVFCLKQIAVEKRHLGIDGLCAGHEDDRRVFNDRPAF